MDRSDWETNPDLIRLELNSATSQLYQQLCNFNATTGICDFKGLVTLEDNIGCGGDDPECDVDTIRTVRVQSLPFPIYYEYVRRPCVEQAFFNDAKKVKDWASSSYVVDNSMCADPRRDAAAGK